MIAALILACCLSAPAEVLVDSDTLVLGALVAFPAGDARAVISLGYAPQPGVARRFQKFELLHKVTSAGLKADDLQLPESVLVRRKAQSLDVDMVKNAVEEAFARQYPDALVNLISVEVPPTPVETGEIHLTATVPAQADLSRAVMVKVDVRGSSSSRSVFARTLAEVQRPQPVLKSAILANAPVSREDVEWKMAQVRSAAPPLESLERLEGMVASRDLAAGQIVTPDLLYAPLMVRKGESVTVRAGAGGIAVAATMRAKKDGRFGETILVEHLSGAGTASARVIGPRTLEALQGVK